MKTLQTTNTRNANRSLEQVRSVMTLSGVVIAILCFVALLLEGPSTPPIDARVPQLLKTSKVVAADLLGEIKTWL